MSTFLNAKVTLGGNRTLGAPTNVKNGQSGCIEIGWANADGEKTSPYYTNGAGPTCSDPNVLPSANTNHTYPYCPDGLFQFHHQAFNYFASFAPGTAQRAHLQDEKAFIAAANGSNGKTCDLKQVSFIKPLGEAAPGRGGARHELLERVAASSIDLGLSPVHRRSPRLSTTRPSPPSQNQHLHEARDAPGARCPAGPHPAARRSCPGELRIRPTG